MKIAVLLSFSIKNRTKRMSAFRLRRNSFVTCLLVTCGGCLLVTCRGCLLVTRGGCLLVPCGGCLLVMCGRCLLVTCVGCLLVKCGLWSMCYRQGGASGSKRSRIILSDLNFSITIAIKTSSIRNRDWHIVTGTGT